jgi:hypothetical protein
MKYIKSFESTDDINLQDYSYWLIPSGKRGIDALKKLNCPEYSLINTDDGEYVYVTYNDDSDYDLRKWGWMPYESSSIEWFNDNNYTYKGEINIPDYELTSIKYNL